MLLKQILQGKTIVLASKSPRRQQLLAELDLPFEVRINGEVDETYPANLTPESIPEYLATKKAVHYIGSLASHEILLTSDTIVCCKGKVLGKPTDRDNAIAILKELSGCKHTVITGVALCYGSREHTFSATTDVYFRTLADEEITHYVDTFKPYDKAGAYGIQEWIGYIGIERIDGSYFNVMGLPVQKLYTELIAFLIEKG